MQATAAIKTLFKWIHKRLKKEEYEFRFEICNTLMEMRKAQIFR